jgi:hypothetical protein
MRSRYKSLLNNMMEAMSIVVRRHALKCTYRLEM